VTSVDRRTWLALAAATIAGARATRSASAQRPDSGRGAADPLPNPDWVGRPRDVVDSADNSRVVTAAERRLRCTCGCGLDVFTCRTTDFTCTYSPALHREALALVAAGKTPDQVVEAFVAKYSETILMAPRERGFGVVGYWLPASLLLAAGGALAWVLLRRARAEHRPVSVRPTIPVSAAELSTEETAQLEQALRDIER
jgi:cytochrome c-type biogenesis protein CcmH/NrfF